MDGVDGVDGEACRCLYEERLKELVEAWRMVHKVVYMHGARRDSSWICIRIRITISSAFIPQ